MRNAKPLPSGPMGHFNKAWWRAAFALFALLVWLGIVLATLYPFEFHPHNDVTWVDGGLRFGQHGIVISQGPLLTDWPDDDSSCSIELLLKPGTLVGSSRFFVISNPNHSEQLKLTQYRDGIIIWRESGQGNNRRALKRDVTHFFNSWEPTLLSITSGSKGTVVYSNGRPLERFPAFPLSRRAMSGLLALGSDTAHIDTWTGQLRGLALYSRELAGQEVAANYRNWSVGSEAHWDNDRARFALFTFRDGQGSVVRNFSPGGPDLTIPASFTLPSKPFLALPWNEFKPDWDYINDILRNILGFVPLGFALCGYLSLAGNQTRAVRTTILIGALTSLAIEVVQGFIPQRESGLTDVLTNTLGTALGALLAQSGSIRNYLRRLPQ